MRRLSTRYFIIVGGICSHSDTAISKGKAPMLGDEIYIRLSPSPSQSCLFGGCYGCLSSSSHQTQLIISLLTLLYALSCEQKRAVHKRLPQIWRRVIVSCSIKIQRAWPNTLFRCLCPHPFGYVVCICMFAEHFCCFKHNMNQVREFEETKVREI